MSWLNKNQNLMDSQFNEFENQTEVQFDDAWGDNIYMPYKNGKYLEGEEAEKYNPFSGWNDHQDMLFKFHTGQSPNLSKVSIEDLNYLKEWYGGFDLEAFERGETESVLGYSSNAESGAYDEIKFARKAINEAIDFKKSK